MPSSASAASAIAAFSLHDALPIYAGGGTGAVCSRAPYADRVPREPHLSCADRPHTNGDGISDHSFVRPHCTSGKRSTHRRAVRLRRSEEHTSELQSPCNLVCRLLRPLPPRSPPFPYTTLFRSMPAAELAPFAAEHRTRIAFLENRTCHVLTGHTPTATGFLITPSFVLTALPVSDRPTAVRFDFGDRKSTRLNSSHLVISYAVFCVRCLRDRRLFPTRRSSDLCRRRNWRRLQPSTVRGSRSSRTAPVMC